MLSIGQVIFFVMFSGFPTPNDSADELVDEKDNHEAIYDFASRADIVVCCLRLNGETVRANIFTFCSSFLGSYREYLLFPDTSLILDCLLSRLA